MQVEKDSVNRVTISAAETLSPCFWLLWFNDPERLIDTFCICTTQYSQNGILILAFTEKADPVFVNGEVYLSPPGNWRLRVYEQTSDTNLDPVNAGRLIRDIQIRVVGETAGGTGWTQTAICDPATVENSDETYSKDVASGDTLVLPDVQHTDSDGSPVTLPAVTPFVATMCGAPAQTDYYYAIAVGHP